MRKFDQEFTRKYVTPLLKEVLVDVATGRKGNQYLGKLFSGTHEAKEPMTVIEKTDFMKDYFLTPVRNVPSHPFFEDKSLRENFFDELQHFFKLRNKLSGPNGARNSYLPNENGDFSDDAEREILRLSLKITHNFEQKRIAKQIDEQEERGQLDMQQAEGKRDLLANGKLILNETNGVQSYEQKPDMAVLSDEERAEQELILEMQLEENGLEVGKDGIYVDENGIAYGQVTDVDGQDLTVSVNLNLDNHDPKKFVFTFHGGQNEEGKSLNGFSFALSQKDLQKFEPQEGLRKSAMEVGLPEQYRTVREKPEELNRTRRVFQKPDLSGINKPGTFVLPQEVAENDEDLARLAALTLGAGLMGQGDLNISVEQQAAPEETREEWVRIPHRGEQPAEPRRGFGFFKSRNAEYDLQYRGRKNEEKKGTVKVPANSIPAQKAAVERQRSFSGNNQAARLQHKKEEAKKKRKRLFRVAVGANVVGGGGIFGSLWLVSNPDTTLKIQEGFLSFSHYVLCISNHCLS